MVPREKFRLTGLKNPFKIIVVKIIVDTSIWIDFFKGTLSQIVASHLIEELGNDQVVITDIILHELLVGARSKKEYDNLLKLMEPFPVLRIADSDLPHFNSYSWKVRKKGLSGKYTDLTIAFLAQYFGCAVLSGDAYFKKLAEKDFVEVIKF